MSRFVRDAMEAGFSQEQAEFMDEWLAKFPHTHDIDEVNGLQEELDNLEGEEDDDED